MRTYHIHHKAPFEYAKNTLLYLTELGGMDYMAEFDQSQTEEAIEIAIEELFENDYSYRMGAIIIISQLLNQIKATTLPHNELN